MVLCMSVVAGWGWTNGEFVPFKIKTLPWGRFLIFIFSPSKSLWCELVLQKTFDFSASMMEGARTKPLRLKGQQNLLSFVNKYVSGCNSKLSLV